MIRGSIEDSRLGMEVLGLYLAHCHIGNGVPKSTERDATGRLQWVWEFSDLREGLADIPQIIEDFKAVGYSGYVSLEEFGPGDDDAKVREQGAYLRELIS